MEFENDYEEVLLFIRDLMFYILQGLQTRYQTQTEIVKREYKTTDFQLPASADLIPILKFSEGIALLKEAGTTTSALEDIK